ncbi:MAG: hypothetical protein O6939_12150 [Bacteroidetes bacterium]|nr:hypothetical protein [Bacteroidota bacterium]
MSTNFTTSASEVSTSRQSRWLSGSGSPLRPVSQNYAKEVFLLIKLPEIASSESVRINSLSSQTIMDLINIYDYEKEALKKLPKMVGDYYATSNLTEVNLDLIF